MERNVLVDKLKGYACFLVLFGHVIMGIRLSGIAIPSFFQGVEQFIWSFHVALFLFLSGVVYRITGEWRGKKTKLRFLLHKLLSLGVPYVVFSAIYIAINSLVGSTNTQSSLSDILTIWRTPVAQYWFLYALFFLFCIWAALSGVVKNWLITLLVVAIGYLAPLLGLSLGCFDVVFSSALAFGTGTFVTLSILTKPSTPVKCAVIFTHLVLGILCVITGTIEKPLVKELMLLLGIWSSILLISLLQDVKPISRFLTFVNRYSFQIYLLHTIFTAGTRILLLRLGIAQWYLHVLLGTVLGLACSVVAAELANRIPFLNFFFFPTKKRKK